MVRNQVRREMLIVTKIQTKYADMILSEIRRQANAQNTQTDR